MMSLNFNSLPPDVIRIIIRVGQESLNGMQLVSEAEFSIEKNLVEISPLWNSLAIEHLNYRTHLPKIESVEIDGRRHLGLHISEKYSQFFGVLKWKCKTLENTV